MVLERGQNNGNENKEDVQMKESEDNREGWEQTEDSDHFDDLTDEDVKLEGKRHATIEETLSIVNSDLIEAFRERCNSLDSLLKEERKLTSQARRTVRRHSVQHVQWADLSSDKKIPLLSEIPIPLREENDETGDDDTVVKPEPIKVPTEKPRPILKKRRNSKVDPNQATCVIIVHEDKEPEPESGE